MLRIATRMIIKFTIVSYPSLSANNADNQRITTSTPNFAPKSAKLGVFIYS